MSRATHRLVVDDCLNSGELLICIKDTDKAVQIKLLKNTLRFSPGHLDMMFGKSNSVSIPISGKSPHKLLAWCDGDVTIYPYRAGVPYLFEKITEGGSSDD